MVPCPRTASIQGSFHQRQDLFIFDSVLVRKEKMNKYPADVGLNENRRLIESEGTDCPGCGRTDSREPLQRLYGVRKHTTILSYHQSTDFMQSDRPAVIAQSLPNFQYLLKWGFVDRIKIWKRQSKLLILCENPPHLSLLQHDL